MSSSPETPGNVTDRMPALAAEFVEAAKASAVALDYLPRTLPIFEKFVRGTSPDTGRAAAYFGEVVRRETKGFWFEQEYVPMVYAGVDPYVDPAAVLKSLLETGRVTAGDTTVESLKSYCENISRLQRLWLDTAVLGNHQNMASLRKELAADAKTAGAVLALAQQAVLTAQLDWSESLNCSPESLDAIERILGTMHKLKQTEPQRITSELIDSMSKSMGIFIGEIVRRQYGGQWRATDDGSFELPYPGTTIHPIVRARKRIVDGPAENVKMYYSGMAKVIAS